MSGGTSSGNESVVLWVVVGLFLVLLIGGPFSLVHGYRLLGLGDSVAGSAYVVVGSLLLLPIVSAVGLFIWSISRKAIIALDRRGR